MAAILHQQRSQVIALWVWSGLDWMGGPEKLTEPHHPIAIDAAADAAASFADRVSRPLFLFYIPCYSAKRFLSRAELQIRP